MIRKAEKNDIPHLLELLQQVGMVHHNIRPDLFKANATKYDEEQLATLITLQSECKPIFVSGDDCGKICGYAFCQITETKNDRLLQDRKTLYIDDICVDEKARGQHIGTSLYSHVKDFAKQIGCYNITLNVWNGNDSAYAFYQHLGMLTQKTCMEEKL